jgi:hypothetical protein
MSEQMMRKPPFTGTKVAMGLAALGIMLVPSIITSVNIMNATAANIKIIAGLSVFFSVLLYIFLAIVPLVAPELSDNRFINPLFWYFLIFFYFYWSELYYNNANFVGAFVVQLLLLIFMLFGIRGLVYARRPALLFVYLVLWVWVLYTVVATGLSQWGSPSTVA